MISATDLYEFLLSQNRTLSHEQTISQVGYYVIYRTEKHAALAGIIFFVFSTEVKYVAFARKSDVGFSCKYKGTIVRSLEFRHITFRRKSIVGHILYGNAAIPNVNYR